MQDCSSYSNNTPGAWVGPSLEAAQNGVVPNAIPVLLPSLAALLPAECDKYHRCHTTNPTLRHPGRRRCTTTVVIPTGAKYEAVIPTGGDVLQPPSSRPERVARSGGTPAFCCCLFLFFAVVCSPPHHPPLRHPDRRRRTLPPQWRDPRISPLLLLLSVLLRNHPPPPSSRPQRSAVEGPPHFFPSKTPANPLVKPLDTKKSP